MTAGSPLLARGSYPSAGELPGITPCRSDPGPRPGWPSLLLVAVALAGASCAKVGRPPGGEIDRTAPEIVSHTPAADETEVASETAILLRFSEGMDRRRTEEAIFIAPRTDLRFRWKGHTLEASAGRLLERQTYVVTVGTEARDRRGNPLPDTYTFAFATGSELNQGRLHGRVFEEDRPAASVQVWAYDMRHFDGRAGTDPPDYRTQSSRDGSYEFKRLSPGRFLVFAYGDKNRNSRLDAGEPLALPAGIHDLSQREDVHAGDLLMSSGHRPAPRLKRVQALAENRLLLAFDHEINAREALVEIDRLEVRAVYSTGDPTRLYVLTGPQQAGEKYRFSRLVIEEQQVSWDQPWRASTRKDRKAPSVVSATPSEIGDSGDSLEIGFDEGMSAAVPGSDFWIDSDSTASVGGSWMWETPTRLVLIPDEPLKPGSYSLRGRLKQLSDSVGLAPADSLVELDFEVIPVSRLPSLSGTVTAKSIPDPGEVTVTARRVPGERTYTTVCDSNGTFSLEKVLPGEYSVTAFADRNGNGAADTGALDPFTPAEAASVTAENVEVRRGQRVAGIDLELR